MRRENALRCVEARGAFVLAREKPMRLNAGLAQPPRTLRRVSTGRIRLLEDDGWFLVATRGSHRQYKHAMIPGRVTVAGKPSDDVAPGMLNRVLKQAGLKERK